MSISVVFPAYNEEASLVDTIERAREALRSLVPQFDIIIVDDASTDRTGAIAEALAAQHSELRVIHNPENVGQGVSLLEGFRHARHDFVLHDAVDYPFDLRDLGKLLARLDDADIVVAVRSRRAGYTPYRTLLSVVNLALLRLLFPLRLRDYNFVQLYRKNVLDTVQVQSRSTAFVTPELLIRAHDLGYRITEVEVDYHPRRTGVATAGRLRFVLASLHDMLRFWLARCRERRRAPRPQPIRRQPRGRTV